MITIELSEWTLIWITVLLFLAVVRTCLDIWLTLQKKQLKEISEENGVPPQQSQSLNDPNSGVRTMRGGRYA